MNHQVNHSKIDHRFTTLRERLIVFAQAAIFTKPCKGSLNNPASWQHHKAGAIIASLNNLQYPFACRGTPVNQLAGIAAIRPNQRQPRKATSQFFQHKLSTVTILNAGRMHNHSQHQTQRIYDQMAFSTRYLLSCIVATFPPFSAVLTDWLSIIAAEGLACRPASTRTCSRRWQ